MFARHGTLLVGFIHRSSWNPPYDIDNMCNRLRIQWQMLNHKYSQTFEIQLDTTAGLRSTNHSYMQSFTYNLPARSSTGFKQKVENFMNFRLSYFSKISETTKAWATHFWSQWLFTTVWTPPPGGAECSSNHFNWTSKRHQWETKDKQCISVNLIAINIKHFSLPVDLENIFINLRFFIVTFFKKQTTKRTNESHEQL